MPDLLLEIYSEDIPAWMQDSAARTLARRIVKDLEDAGVSSEERESFVTPRRMALVVRGLPAVQPARTDERKGPRVSAPNKAIEGFLRSAGVQSVGDLETRDDGKGEFYVAVTREDERPLAALLAEKIPGVLKEFPWAKSMRWGDGTFRWARPLRSILCVFDGEVVPFEVAGIAAGNMTRGHPVMAPGTITIGGAGEYQDKLKKAHVRLKIGWRREVIRDGLAAIAKKHRVDFVEDEGLAIETAGQVEWPVVLCGRIDARFMDLPEELLISVMRTHQQNFAFRDKKTGKLASLFAAVADVDVSDGGKAIIAGNEAVLRARLADALFYWEEDCRVGLEEHRKKASSIIFHSKFSSVYGKARRLENIWHKQYPARLYKNKKIIEENLKFIKSDLATGTVREFPELQGIVGYYLALRDNRFSAEQSRIIPEIIREHYLPMGSDDALPSSEEAQWVAFFDNLDTLVSFFILDEKLSGSADPHGLRRAALSNLRILLEGKINFFPLLGSTILACAVNVRDTIKDDRYFQEVFNKAWKKHMDDDREEENFEIDKNIYMDPKIKLMDPEKVRDQVLDFMEKRLKVHLRNNRGIPHDVIDAVLCPARPWSKDSVCYGIDRPLWSVRLIYALTEFINTDDGTNLLAGYKRADNILQIEERKDAAKEKQGTPQDAGQDDDPSPDSTSPPKKAEKNLANALKVAEKGPATALNKDDLTTPDQDDFTAAMTALAKLRQPLDAFFDSVTVNDSDKNLRANRLKLLSRVRKVMRLVADFSRIEGGERKQS